MFKTERSAAYRRVCRGFVQSLIINNTACENQSRGCIVTGSSDRDQDLLLPLSYSGSYAKSKLKLIRIGIVNDSKKSKKAATIITNCAQRYDNADKSAQDQFSI